jgi:hypothetical protein
MMCGKKLTKRRVQSTYTPTMAEPNVKRYLCLIGAIISSRPPTERYFSLPSDMANLCFMSGLKDFLKILLPKNAVCGQADVTQTPC